MEKLFSYFKLIDFDYSGIPEAEKYLPLLVTNFTAEASRRSSLSQRSARLVNLAKYCWFDQGRRCQSVCGAAFYFALAVDLCGIKPPAKSVKWIADRLCVSLSVLKSRIRELRNVMVRHQLISHDRKL